MRLMIVIMKTNLAYFVKYFSRAGGGWGGGGSQVGRSGEAGG